MTQPTKSPKNPGRFTYVEKEDSAMRVLSSHVLLAVPVVAAVVCLGLQNAHPGDPEAAIVQLLAGLKRQHGIKFAPPKDGRRTIELPVPGSKNRTHMVYLFAPSAAVIFGQRYVTLYGFSGSSKGVATLRALNQANASTVLGTWFVGQNGLLTYKIVVPVNTQVADFNNLVLLVAGASDAKERELNANDKY